MMTNGSTKSSSIESDLALTTQRRRRRRKKSTRAKPRAMSCAVDAIRLEASIGQSYILAQFRHLRVGYYFFAFCEHSWDQKKKKKSLTDSRIRYRPVWIYRYEGLWFFEFHHHFPFHQIPPSTTRSTTLEPLLAIHKWNTLTANGELAMSLFICLFVYLFVRLLCVPTRKN